MVGFLLALEGPALQAYRTLIRDLKLRAIKELNLSEDEITIRSLRPEDIGHTGPSSTFNISSAGWVTIINSQTIADNRFVGINGILVGESGTSVVDQLKITRAGQTKRYWAIQDANLTENGTLWFLDPVIVDQNTTITIEAYGSATDSAWRGLFLGAVAEKKGLLVQ